MSDAMKDVTFTIEGMRCANCSNSAQQALRMLPGVESATVDFHSMQAQVRYDEARVSPDQLAATVERTGFHAKGIE